MAHHLLSLFFQQAFGKALEQDQSTATQLQGWQQSRRRFLKDAALTAGGLTLLPAALRALPVGGKEKIAIIGAGIAGLNAAWHLKKQGVNAELYEASTRVGGRMYTFTDVFGKDISTDLGGEFVDTTHSEIISLVKELGLDFWDLRTDTLIPQAFFFEGRLYSEEELLEAIKPFVKRLVKDITSLPESISYQTADQFKQFDELSIMEYLVGIGIDGWLLRFLDVLMTREYGMEASEQSAINFLIMFDAPAEKGGEYRLFGAAHEVLKIKGGSMKLATTLEKKVQDQIRFAHHLTAITALPDGRMELSFRTGKSAKTVTADYVISTLPFTILRNLELNIQMPEEKRNCINLLGYGNSCKFIMGMRRKPWRQLQFQGYTFTDTAFGCGWDSSQLQSKFQGSFTVFGGGGFSDYINATTNEALQNDFTAAMERIYPGSVAAATGRNLKYCWAGNPLSKGGYSSMKKGQWSTLAGWEALPLGNLYFAGEQVSLEFQGYMNGAASTGRQAAEAILAKIKAKTS